MNTPEGAPITREALAPVSAQIEAGSEGGKVTPLKFKRFLPPDLKGPTPHQRWFRFVTRTVDLVVAGGALLVFSPLFLLLAIVIRSDSPGPVFYRRGTTWVNRRKPRSDVGAIERRKLDRHAAAFHQYKFRSMYVDARTRFPTRYAYAYTAEQLRTLPMKALLAADVRTQRARYPRWFSRPRPACHTRWLVAPPYQPG